MSFFCAEIAVLEHKVLWEVKVCAGEAIILHKVEFAWSLVPGMSVSLQSLQAGCDVFFHYSWEVFFFQGVDALGKAVGSIIRQYGAGGLEEVGAGVVDGVNQMDCDAGNRFPSLQDCLVHVLSVHSFAAEFWEQGGVNVYDAARIGGYKSFGNFKEVTGQNDVVYGVLLQQ